MTPHFLIWSLGPKTRSVDGICHQTDSMNRFYLDVKTGPKLSRKYLKHKNAHGDCDAAMIAKTAAAVTHVQSLSQEVGSGDEGLGLFGYDLSSAETDFWWLGEEQRRRN